MVWHLGYRLGDLRRSSKPEKGPKYQTCERDHQSEVLTREGHIKADK